MPAKLELSGKRFGRLVVIAETARTGNSSKWTCLCDCGVRIDVITPSLRNGNTSSCGCIRREMLSKRNSDSAPHKVKKNPLYKTWSSMRARCENPNDIEYANYGGRGIQVCDRWADFLSFIEDMGDRPAGMTLDRRDVNGNYEKDNCRWATGSEQCRNKRNNRIVEHLGETLCIAEWSDRTGINKTTLNDRLNAGWTTSEALTIRPGERGSAARQAPALNATLPAFPQE
ncbi:hypothetical protein [Pseudomonas fluorescens]|uniref:hypothetical protein n=1 Tax=Pseudomonas fluorescens TaxID=294 RepID=UPI000ACA0BD0|nr:hypothetical protein [Pseudomonas fluorescens]